jgi:hypothetical protein
MLVSGRIANDEVAPSRIERGLAEWKRGGIQDLTEQLAGGRRRRCRRSGHSASEITGRISTGGGHNGVVTEVLEDVRQVQPVVPPRTVSFDSRIE